MSQGEGCAGEVFPATSYHCSQKSPSDFTFVLFQRRVGRRVEVGDFSISPCSTPHFQSFLVPPSFPAFLGICGGNWMLPTDSLSRRLSSRCLCSSKSVTIYPFALQLSKHHQLLSAVGSFPIPLSSIILVESCEMVKISYAHFAMFT